MVLRRKKDGRRSGVMLLVIGTLVTCLLLVGNGVLVSSLYRAFVPASMDVPKLRTMVSMLIMVGLLLPEWWLLDWSGARIRSFYRWLEGAPTDVGS